MRKGLSMRAWLVVLAALCSSCGPPAYAQTCDPGTRSVAAAMEKITTAEVPWMAISGELFKKLVAVMKAEIDPSPFRFDEAESFLVILFNDEFRVGFVKKGCVFQVLVLKKDFLVMIDKAFGR